MRRAFVVGHGVHAGRGVRLGRSRWEPSRRSMGLLRLGRSDGDEAGVDETADKRSMQLLRLGRKRNGDEELEVADPGQLMSRRCALQ